MWAELITTILGIIFITIVVIFGFRYNRIESKLDVRPNAPLLEIRANRIKPFTDGYMRGQIKEQIENKNGTTYISFYPDDVFQGETAVRPDFKDFVVDSAFIKREAEGDDKARRQTIIILPRSKADLPRKLRSTYEGDELTKEGQLAFMESILGERIIAGDEAFLEMARKHNRTGMSKATLKLLEEEQKKIRNMSPTSIPPQNPPPEHRTA